MSEPTPEAPAPEIPEPTELETVARLAAEAAVRGLQLQIPADLVPRLEAAEQGLAEIRQLLAAAAGPDGNGARLTARLDALEGQLRDLTEQPPAVPVEQQQLLDDLRLKVANLERNPNRA